MGHLSVKLLLMKWFNTATMCIKMAKAACRKLNDVYTSVKTTILFSSKFQHNSIKTLLKWWQLHCAMTIGFCCDSSKSLLSPWHFINLSFLFEGKSSWTLSFTMYECGKCESRVCFINVFSLLYLGHKHRQNRNSTESQPWRRVLLFRVTQDDHPDLVCLEVQLHLLSHQCLADLEYP